MSHAEPPTGPASVAVALCTTLLLSGCFETPGEGAVGVEEWVGTAVVQPDPQGGTALRLAGTGWARVDLTAATATTLHVHPMRETPAGLVDVHELDAALVRPGEFLSVTLFATDGRDFLPMYDLLVWGFPPALRDHTRGGEDFIGFANPGHAEVAPDAPGVLVVATNMEGMVVEVLSGGADATSGELVVRPVAHPRLVSAYHDDGAVTYVGAGGVVTAEDREDFPDTSVAGRGLDALVVWQSGEGGARYGSMAEEMGHRMEDGSCSGRGFMDGLFVDEEDPTGSVPVLSVAASKGWHDDEGARELCAAAVATMVGEWQRTGAGAWFFHSPFDAPTT